MDWPKIVSMAVAVVGIVQFFKTAKNWWPIPDWTWWIALPVVAAGLVVAVFYGPAWILQVGLVIALAQLGYESIVKLIQKKIDSM